MRKYFIVFHFNMIIFTTVSNTNARMYEVLVMFAQFETYCSNQCIAVNITGIQGWILVFVVKYA